MLHRWPISLRQPPQIVAMGRPTHGIHLREEPWCLSLAWSLHSYRYHGRLSIDGGPPLPIRPGSISVVPPGHRYIHCFQGNSVHTYCHFTLSAPHAADRHLPSLIHAADESFDRAFGVALASYASDGERAAVRLHDLLYTLAAWPLDDTGEALPESPLAATEALIEWNLATRLSVCDLAERAGISHNQLTRLFKRAHGMTVVAYIRERRLQQARHLLLNSQAPIRAIAASVGIDDPQYFNKLIRQRFGSAPVRLRTGE